MSKCQEQVLGYITLELRVGSLTRTKWRHFVFTFCALTLDFSDGPDNLMWACFCWLQKSWVCHLILKTMLSCPGLILVLQSTISLTAGSVEHSLLHQWKASHDGHLHFKEKTFSKSANNFDNSLMWYLFFIWWHLTTLKWLLNLLLLQQLPPTTSWGPWIRNSR